MADLDPANPMAMAQALMRYPASNNILDLRNPDEEVIYGFLNKPGDYNPPPRAQIGPDPSAGWQLPVQGGYFDIGLRNGPHHSTNGK